MATTGGMWGGVQPTPVTINSHPEWRVERVNKFAQSDAHKFVGMPFFNLLKEAVLFEGDCAVSVQTLNAMFRDCERDVQGVDDDLEKESDKSIPIADYRAICDHVSYFHTVCGWLGVAVSFNQNRMAIDTGSTKLRDLYTLCGMKRRLPLGSKVFIIIAVYPEKRGVFQRVLVGYGFQPPDKLIIQTQMDLTGAICSFGEIAYLRQVGIINTKKGSPGYLDPSMGAVVHEIFIHTLPKFSITGHELIEKVFTKIE